MDSSLLNDYVNSWVALSPDRKKVIASGKNLKELLKKIKEDNNESILHFVLPNDGFYAP